MYFIHYLILIFKFKKEYTVYTIIIGDADFRCFWVALSCFATSSVFAKKPKKT